MQLPLWLLALSGCAAYGPPHIRGRVELAVEIDPRVFATLELRGYATYDLADPPDLESAYHESIPIADVKFPYEYRLREERPSGDHVFLHAWLAREPGAIAATRAEPYGKAVAELCYCATESPPSAIANITIDSVVE